MAETSEPPGPDLARGISIDDLPEGRMLAGHVETEPVLIARCNGEFFAIGAACTHYGGPLAEGLLQGDTVRCPWHHACFSLRTGEALRPPALSPVACWSVARRGDKLFVDHKRQTVEAATRRVAATRGKSPDKIVIVGGGAAGFAAVEKLRREGWQGSLVVLSNDNAPPVDRPNLSKDYLAGAAPEDWVPLRPESFYAEKDIKLRLNANVVGIEVREREVVLAEGERISYDRLLLATGAEPVQLTIPGAAQSNVRVLRSFEDSRSIIARAARAQRAVVLGASFIGLEVAASLRARQMDVHVVAPEQRPMERILGPDMGDFVRALHEEHGVIFHLRDAAAAIDGDRVVLKSGGTLQTDLVVVGIGVRPRTHLAEKAGIALDRGIKVDAYLETSAPGIFAAGDIARWHDPHSGHDIRVEHWVVAERQGQTAALNMLGAKERFEAVPFFWSQHYDVPINYVGHAEQWDKIDIDGEIRSRDCMLRYCRNGKVLAVASIFRDVDSLREELAMESAVARGGQTSGA
jgi:NADPH-dependent 2,4-dienoyl-CoA reductase/sulfur reductase-like enzyme/nitrite reductase/ring-hydroxylating ferredoxin subunit